MVIEERKLNTYVFRIQVKRALRMRIDTSFDRHMKIPIQHYLGLLLQYSAVDGMTQIILLTVVVLRR